MLTYHDSTFWAPQVGDTWPGSTPEAVYYDPIGNEHYQSLPYTANASDFLPAWSWVQPPGVGDAPQHVWRTFSLYPLSLDGPGDRPASYLAITGAPLVANFAARWQGMPVDGGNLLLTGLYVPEPQESMSNDVYSGS